MTGTPHFSLVFSVIISHCGYALKISQASEVLICFVVTQDVSNKKITEIEGCEPLLETVDTNDDHKVNCIHSVVKPGYEIRITEKEKRILKKAEVKVYSKEEKQWAK